MNSIEKRLYSAVAMVFVCWTFASCGKDSPTEPVPQTPARITLSPEAATLTAVGQTITIDRHGTGPGRQGHRGAGIWCSTLPRKGGQGLVTNGRHVVKVDTNGLVTALTNGYVQIAATSGSVSTSASIVVAQAPGRIEVMPSSSTLSALGETVQLTYTVYDGNDEPIPGAGVSWSSDDDSVATVSVNGLVTAVGNGRTRITAASNGVSDSVIVAVEIDL